MPNIKGLLGFLFWFIYFFVLPLDSDFHRNLVIEEGFIPGPSHFVEQFCLLQVHEQDHHSLAQVACWLPEACDSPSAEKEPTSRKLTEQREKRRCIYLYFRKEV